MEIQAAEILPETPATESDLLEQPIRSTTLLVPKVVDNAPDFVNQVYSVEMTNGRKAISKPKDGEADLDREVMEGTYYLRERASYLVDSAIGFDLIPTTVIREINGQISSLQDFIPGTTDIPTVGEHTFVDMVRDDRDLDLQIQKLYILDYLIFSSDRSDKNILIKNGRIYAIDNGLTFGHDEFWPLGTQEFFTQKEKKFTPEDEIVLKYSHKYDQEILKYIDGLVSDSSKLEKLEKDLGELIKPEEIIAFRHRLLFLHNALKNPDQDLSKSALKFDPVS